MLGEAGLRYRHPEAFWLRKVLCEGSGVNWAFGEGKTAVSAENWFLKLCCRVRTWKKDKQGYQDQGSKVTESS